MRARWEGPQRLALETGAARAEGSTNSKDVGGAPTTSCPAPRPWDPFDPIRRRPLLSGSETLPREVRCRCCNPWRPGPFPPSAEV